MSIRAFIFFVIVIITLGAIGFAIGFMLFFVLVDSLGWCGAEAHTAFVYCSFVAAGAGTLGGLLGGAVGTWGMVVYNRRVTGTIEPTEPEPPE